jgi:hypothetical protein
MSEKEDKKKYSSKDKDDFEEEFEDEKEVGNDEEDFESGFNRRAARQDFFAFINRYIFLGILFLIIIIFFLANFSFVSNFFKSLPQNTTSVENVCGDGTKFTYCSVRIPYFCENGELIEQAFVCPCPDGFYSSRDKCISEFNTGAKNVSFNYTLRGVNDSINLTLYSGMYKYFSGLPAVYSTGVGNTLSRGEYKLEKINEVTQAKFLSSLVVAIQNKAKDKDDQVRIAISLVQNIPFKESNKRVQISKSISVLYTRYPYETLYENSGICGEKSELLAYLLEELGYGVVLFEYSSVNHEAVGISCPIEYSLNESGYCFVETTAPSIISNNKNEYYGVGSLEKVPFEILPISKGNSLREDLDEYEDSIDWNKIQSLVKAGRSLTRGQMILRENLIEKYGMSAFY